jgi:hypothetical protein
MQSYVLTKAIEQGLSPEAGNGSDSQEIPCPLWNQQILFKTPTGPYAKPEEYVPNVETIFILISHYSLCLNLPRIFSFRSLDYDFGREDDIKMNIKEMRW